MFRKRKAFRYWLLKPRPLFNSGEFTFKTEVPKTGITLPVGFNLQRLVLLAAFGTLQIFIAAAAGMPKPY